MGSLLPAVRLPPADGGSEAGLRDGRGPRIVVSVHPQPCADCADYVRRLAEGMAAIREWDGLVRIVVPAGGTGVAGGSAPARLAHITDADGFRLLRDPEGAFASGGAVVVVADEWGEVHFRSSLGDHGRAAKISPASAAGAASAADVEGGSAADADAVAPTVEELADWVRFIAIQCPECENPEGGWRSL